MKELINIISCIDIVSLSKMYMIVLFTYVTSLKISNCIEIKKLKLLISSLCISILYYIIKCNFDFVICTTLLILILALILMLIEKKSLIYSIVVVSLAFAINNVVYFCALVVVYLGKGILIKVNEYFTFIVIALLYVLIMKMLWNVKRFKNGFSFLSKNLNDDLFLLLVLNIGAVIIFSSILIINYSEDKTGRLIIGLIIFAIIMFITIQKSIQAYYKQKLLIQDLTETKKELEEKKKEVEDLEKENLKFSMRSHSIAHKQRSLEYKLNKILQSTETAEEIELKNRMENIEKEAYVAPFAVALVKTEIEPIDDMLEYMQAECAKDNIEFNLQINGNIHKMVNNYVEKQDLEILLADHIKDAIIAINHTDNINRSILVKLGEFDNCYSLNIYDSGVKFPKEILENLGKKPVTSYPNEGGTGMGYMNTFKMLKKYKASLIIEEFGMPSKENFTKVVSIIFDKKNEFKIL